MQGEESEQLFLNLEQRHFSLKREHEAVCSERDAVKDKVANLERSLEESRNIAEKLQKEIISKDTELIQKNNTVKEYAQVKEEANERLKRRTDECERLREDLKSQADELTTFRSRNRENQNILADTQAQLMPIQFELIKATRENDSLKNRVADLENDISVLQEESVNSRREHTKKVFDLESSVTEKSALMDEYNRKIKSLQDQLTLRNESVEEYSTRLKDCEHRLAEQESTFVQELDGLKKMVDIYKHHFEEATNRVEELETAANSANEIIATQLTQVKNKYVAEIELLRNQWKKEKEEKDNKIQELETRVQQQQWQSSSSSSQQLLLSSPASDFIPSLVPSTSTSTASAIDADFFSLSTSEMYNRVVTAERSRVLEISKRREVELYLDRILKDVEAKAPLIANQKRDYNRVLESHSQLTQRLDDLSHDNAQLKNIAKQLENKAKQAAEEVLVYKQQNTDLSSQLQHLLKKYYEAQYGSMTGSSSGSGSSGGIYGSPKPVVALIGYGDDSSGTTAGAAVPATPENVISNFLVTFDDIKELQTRNAQLLQVVRKLSLEQEKDLSALQHQQGQQGFGDESSMLVDTAGTDAQTLKETSAALTDALKELSALRQARQRTEGMVVGLVQQRDMYKAMVEEMNGSIDFQRKSTAITASANVSSSSFESSIQSPVAVGRGAGNNTSSSSSTTAVTMDTSPASGTSTVSSVKRVTELQSQLTQLQEENRRLNERMSRLNESEQLVNQSLDSVKQENVVLRLESSKNTSEAKFQKERSERLEESLKQSQLEVSATSQRKLEIEKELIETQRNARLKDDSLFQYTLNIKSLEDTVKRLEIDLEVSRGSEVRLMQQLTEQREESRRQLSLTESIQRIEIGLSSRVEEEKTVLQQERDALSRSLDTVRKQMNQRELVDDQRIRTLEEDVKSLQQRINEKSDQYATVQQELTREQVTCKAAQERASLLEKQLSVVNERLTSIHGANTFDSILQTTITEQELLLEKSQAEIEALKSQLAVSESHAEQFRLISAATEKTLKELNEQSKLSRQAYEDELMKIQVTVNSLQEELTTQRAATAVALKEVEEAREQLRDMPKQHASEIKTLQDSLTSSEQVRNEAVNQVTQLKLDVTKYQEAARKSYINYERELQLHAEAERSRHVLEIECDEIKQSLRSEQERNAELSAVSIRREQVLMEEKNKLMMASQEHKVDIESLRKTNELLHGQVQSLGVQVDRLLEGRVTVSTGSGGISTVSTSGSVVTGVVLEGVGSGTQPLASSTGLSSSVVEEELKELRNTSSELREVVRHIKRERDILESKLSVAETENNRYNHTIQALQRNLDEVKTELKREVEKRVTIHTEDEFSRLMAEVNQLNLIRESNAHLRYENEELSKKCQSLSQQLEKESHDNAPLKEQIRVLTAEKEGLEISNQGLLKDTNYWRERLHQLVSRYNDVDPEEHRLLQEKCTTLSTQIIELNTALETAAKSNTEAIANKDKELSSLKSSYDTLDKTSLQLRDKMRVLKTKFDEQVKKSNDLTKSNNDLRNEVQKLTSELAVAMSTASRVEQELQQRIEKLNQESVELLAQVTRAAVTSATPATVTTTTPAPAEVVSTLPSTFVSVAESSPLVSSTALITTAATPQVPPPTAVAPTVPPAVAAVPPAAAAVAPTVPPAVAAIPAAPAAVPPLIASSSAAAPVAKPATSGEEKMRAMREMLLLKQAQRESSLASSSSSVAATSVAAPAAVTTTASPVVNTAPPTTASAPPVSTSQVAASAEVSLTTTAPSVTADNLSADASSQQVTKKARFAEDVVSQVQRHQDQDPIVENMMIEAISTNNNNNNHIRADTDETAATQVVASSSSSSPPATTSSAFSSLISTNSMNPFAKPFQFATTTNDAIGTGIVSAPVTTGTAGTSIFGFKTITPSLSSTFGTAVTGATASPFPTPSVFALPQHTPGGGDGGAMEEGERERDNQQPAAEGSIVQGDDSDHQHEQQGRVGEIVDKGDDEEMMLRENTNNNFDDQQQKSQKDEELALTTSAASSSSTGSSNNGPFLNLRPPSPSQTNKHLIPVFGTKKSATPTSSSLVPSLTLPLSTAATAGTTTPSPFGMFSGTSGNTGSGIFGTPGQPKVMSGSIFGNAAVASTGTGMSAPSLLTPSAAAAVASSASITAASFNSLLSKANTGGSTTSGTAAGGTSGGMFGNAFSLDKMQQSQGPPASITAATPISPSPFASTSSLFGMNKPVASPFNTAVTTTTTSTSTSQQPIGIPSTESAPAAVAVVSTEKESTSELLPVEEGELAEVNTSATVKLVGKQQPLSAEEQKRRRMEKFANAGLITLPSAATSAGSSSSSANAAGGVLGVPKGPKRKQPTRAAAAAARLAAKQQAQAPVVGTGTESVTEAVGEGDAQTSQQQTSVEASETGEGDSHQQHQEEEQHEEA